MITGAVSADYKPQVPLRVRGPAGDLADVTAVMDTGFTGSLALPAATVAVLGLRAIDDREYSLADGTPLIVPRHAGEVEWGLGWKPLLILAVGDEPLLGMALLDGHRVYMEATPGGLVDIVPLP